MVALKQGSSMSRDQDSFGQSLPLPSKLLARLHEVSSVFSSESHNKAVSLALRERKNNGPGYSKKMNSLYCLWSNRLREAFHTNTYLMFMRLAQEDATAGDAYGMECLFRFLSYGLERRFRRELFLDFEDLALAQYKNGDMYGVEKYAAFWHYGGSKVVPSELKTNTQLMHLIKDKYPTLSAFKDARYVEKEDLDYVPEVLQSHLGVEVPASPARSHMAFSEFSFDFDHHEDILISSSPPTTSLLSASAPSFYPMGPLRWAHSGGSGLLPTSSSMGPQYVRVYLRAQAGGNTVTVCFTVDGKPVGAATAPRPVQRTSSGASSWSAARAARNSANGSALSGSIPRDSSYGPDASFGRSPPFGSGRATTAARPVGQPWKSARGHNRRGTRTDASSQELGTSLGASPTVSTPIGMSPVGFSAMSSLRGGMRGRPPPRGGLPSSIEKGSEWPANWNHKGRDKRRNGGKGGSGSASSSWTGSRSRWGGRENQSDNHPRSVLRQSGCAVDVESSNSVPGDAGGEFTGAEIVTGAEPLEVAEDKSPSPNDSDVSQMTDCSGYAHDDGGPSGNSLKQKFSEQEAEIMRLKEALEISKSKLHEWEALGFTT